MTEAAKFKEIVFGNGSTRLNVFIYAGCHGIEDSGHVWAVFPDHGDMFDLTGFAEECSKGPNVEVYAFFDCCREFVKKA